jgi:hypothetical protein
MSEYSNLRANKPVLTVAKNAKEVIFETVSCMCDNKGVIKFKKNSEGDFKMNGMGFCLSNWQMKYPTYDIEWKADEGKWYEVVDMVNSGTAAVKNVKSR